jgi:hypothetical protein
VNLYFGVDLTLDDVQAVVTGNLDFLSHAGTSSVMNKVTVTGSMLLAGGRLRANLSDLGTVVVEQSMLVAIADRLILTAGATVQGIVRVTDNVLMSSQPDVATVEVLLDSTGASMATRTTSRLNTFVAVGDVRIASDGTTVARDNDFTLVGDNTAIVGGMGCTTSGNIPPFTC